MKRILVAASTSMALCVAAAAGAPALAQDDDLAMRIEAALASSDRSEGDLARDERRRPALSLEIVNPEPGDRILDLSSGGGYMVRLYAELVGPDGFVMAQNSEGMLARMPDIADTFAAMGDNVGLMLAAHDALEGEPGSYDKVTITLSYHDVVNGSADRDAMNAQIFELLKPGGEYVIIDHLAETGAGPDASSTLHRLDKDFLQAEVESAGFVLDRESDLLLNPDDVLTERTREAEGGSSQFAVIFTKP